MMIGSIIKAMMLTCWFGCAEYKKYDGDDDDAATAAAAADGDDGW